MAVDLYVLYLRSFSAVCAGAPLPEEPLSAINEPVPAHALAIALGAEDAIGWKANAAGTEDAEDADGDLGIRTRVGVLERIELLNRDAEDEGGENVPGSRPPFAASA